MSPAKRDFVCGSGFFAIGGFFAVNAWLQLRIGSAVAMGPGFFPFALGFVLCTFGALIILGSSGAIGDAPRAIGWRGISLIGLAVLTFALTVQPMGMLPSLFAATMIAAFAPKQARLVPALVLSTVLTAFNIGVFVYALQLPYPIVGELLKEMVR